MLDKRPPRPLLRFTRCSDFRLTANGACKVLTTCLKIEASLAFRHYRAVGTRLSAGTTAELVKECLNDTRAKGVLEDLCAARSRR
jgi:hypothetical protein